QEKRPHYESDSSAISSIFASSSGSTSPCISGFIAMNWAAHCKSSFVSKSLLWSDQPRSPDACDSSSARHPETQGRPNDGVGEPPPHEAARCLRLHWPPAAGHSAEPVGHRATSAFWSSPPWELWLCFRPSAPAVSDLSSCDSWPSFDSKLALFGAFWGVVTSSGRHCPMLSPCPGWPAACAPSWDKILFLSFVESSMTRLESWLTIGPELPSVIGSLLWPSSQPPASTSHGSSPIFSSPPATWHSSSATWHSSSAIWHLPSAIWHLPSAIWHLPSAIWHLPSAFSPFPVPNSSFRIIRRVSSFRSS